MTDTNYVPVFLIICVISMLVLLAASLQLSFSVRLEADALNKGGYLALYFFGISIVKLDIEFVSFDLDLKRLKIKVNKRDVSMIFAPKGEKDSVFNYIASPVFSIIDFIYFDIEFSFGYSKDAFVTMLVTQAARMAAQSAAAVLKSSQEIEVREIFTPQYNKDTLNLTFFGIISMSIANIIYSLFHALAIRAGKKSVKQAKAKALKETIYDKH